MRQRGGGKEAGLSPLTAPRRLACLGGRVRGRGVGKGTPPNALAPPGWRSGPPTRWRGKAGAGAGAPRRPGLSRKGGLKKPARAAPPPNRPRAAAAHAGGRLLARRFSRGPCPPRTRPPPPFSATTQCLASTVGCGRACGGVPRPSPARISAGSSCPPFSLAPSNKKEKKNTYLPRPMTRRSDRSDACSPRSRPAAMQGGGWGRVAGSGWPILGAGRVGGEERGKAMGCVLEVSLSVARVVSDGRRPAAPLQ